MRGVIGWQARCPPSVRLLEECDGLDEAMCIIRELE
jgi:hypothetical protein